MMIFQNVCGSLTSLLKITGVVGQGGVASDGEQSGGEQSTTSNADDSANIGGGSGAATSSDQDMQQKMSSGLDSLDSLLAKTENAQYAMAHQSKQMKSFLK